MNSFRYVLKYISSLIPKKAENRVLLSLAVFTVAKFLEANIESSIPTYIQILSVVYFLAVVFFSPKRNPLRGFTGVSYTLLLVWLFILLFRLAFIPYSEYADSRYYAVRSWMLDSMVLPSIFPVFLLVLRKNYKWDARYFVRLSVALLLLYLIVTPFAYYNITHFDLNLSAKMGDEDSYNTFIANAGLGISYLLPPTILLYFKKYINNRIWYLILFALLANLMMSLFLARRGGSVLNVMYLALCWYLYYKTSKLSKKMNMLIVAFLMLSLLSVYLFQKFSTTFELLNSRIGEDTRSAVELAFYADMNTVKDWIFGRGLYGRYYDFNYSDYRFSIETGYLTLILRGGVIYLALYVATLLSSAIHGLRKSNNVMVKSFAIMILMSIFELYPYGLPEFNIKFFVIWIGVYICSSSDYCKLSDAQVKYLFFNNKKIKKIKAS